LTKKNFYVAISGVHGVGKSTILKKLCEKNTEFIKINETTIPVVHSEQISNPVLRELWFYSNYVKREQFEIQNAGLKIADRWVNDIKIYISAMLSSNMINTAEYTSLNSVINSRQWTEPDMEIVIIADEKELLKRIENRSRDSKEVLKEKDLEFLKKVNSGFIEYAKMNQGLRPVILIDTSNMNEETAARIVEKEINKILV